MSDAGPGRVAASAGTAFALALPWRIWVSANGFKSDEPQTGFLGFLDDPGRALPSLWLAVRAMFGYDFWLVLPVVTVVAAILAILAGARRQGVFAIVFVSAAVSANAWVTWSHPAFGLTLDYSLNPATRFMVTPALVAAAVTPALLERAWGRPRAPAGRSRREALGWAVAGAALLIYPASMLAGVSSFRLPGGSPPFPSRDECVREAMPGQPMRVVLGYADSYVVAAALSARARVAAIEGVDVARDGCGRLRVYVDDVPSIADAEALAVRAVAAHLTPTIEHDPDE